MDSRLLLMRYGFSSILLLYVYKLWPIGRRFGYTTEGFTNDSAIANENSSSQYTWLMNFVRLIRFSG